MKAPGKDGFSLDTKPIAQVADELGMPTGAGWAEDCQGKSRLLMSIELASPAPRQYSRADDTDLALSAL